MATEVPAPGEGRLAPLRRAAYRRVWLGAVLFSLGQWMERTAIGWYVLDLTGSVFLTALAWAVRSLPSLLFGPISGAIADRYPRGPVLAFNTALRALAVGVLALVVAGGRDVVEILLLVALSGVTATVQLAASQSLAAETAGPGRLASGVSLLSLGQRSVGAIAALSAGFLLDGVGAAATFGLAALPLLLASAAFASVRTTPRPAATTRLTADVLEGVRVVFRVPIVALLLGLMIVVEILGFSYNALLPAVAERLLEVGPRGLGTLMAGAAVGSMLGTAALAALAHRGVRGVLLPIVIVSFGLLLGGLAVSRSFILSVGICAGIGAMAGLVDALEWTLLQASVDERLRGRVLGAWNHAIGWGWIGPVALGALAEGVGVQGALLLAGGLLALAGIASFASAALRRA